MKFAAERYRDVMGKILGLRSSRRSGGRSGESLNGAAPGIAGRIRLPGGILLRLNAVRLENRGDQTRETLIDLLAAGRVVHLDAPALSPNQPRIAQRLEMLGKRGLGNRLLADIEKVRTVLRAGRTGNLREDGHPQWIRESMQDPLDSDVVDGGVKEGAHLSNLPALDRLFNSSYVRDYGMNIVCAHAVRGVVPEKFKQGNPMSKLTGKVAVVTGASKGIGAAIAKSLAAEGASVVVNYSSSKAGAEAVVAAITSAGGKAIAVQGDVSKAAEAEGLIEAAVKNYGRLDILVNNSGVYEFAPIEAITEESFHRLFNINVLGLLLTTQAAVKHIGEGGSIINVGSSITRIRPAGSAVYSATKGAVDQITSVLSKELGPKKIRVNSINPGLVETEGTHTAGIIGSDMEKGFVAMTPLGRAGRPSDIASIAVFLASEDSGWLTGELLNPSGGL